MTSGPAMQTNDISDTSVGQSVASGGASAALPWPLDLRVSPVLGFMEIPLVGHASYTSIEIQHLRTQSGVGLAAIVHRVDHRVDVYFEAALELDRDWHHADPAMMHLVPGVLEPVVFDARLLEIDVDSVRCDIAFRDVRGDLVRLQVEQKSTGGQRVQMFIPVPAETRKPVLRLLTVDKFCMLRRRATTVEIHVGDERCTPALFALPIGFSRRYSGRFSQPVLLAGLNRTGRYRPDPLPQLALDADGNLRRARVEQGENWFELRFEPALPKTDSLAVGSRRVGAMSIHSPVGAVTQCRWLMRRTEEQAIELEFTDVRQNWFPSIWRNPTLSVLAALRWLKRRNTQLSWLGRVEIDNGEPIMTSSWLSNGVAHDAPTDSN